MPDPGPAWFSVAWFATPVFKDRNMKRYKLDCLEWNNRHVRFNVFDPSGANCGTLHVLAHDAINFVKHSWKGDIFWNGKMPQAIVEGIGSLTER